MVNFDKTLLLVKPEFMARAREMLEANPVLKGVKIVNTGEVGEEVVCGLLGAKYLGAARRPDGGPLWRVRLESG